MGDGQDSSKGLVRQQEGKAEGCIGEGRRTFAGQENTSGGVTWKVGMHLKATLAAATGEIVLPPAFFLLPRAAAGSICRR